MDVKELWSSMGSQQSGEGAATEEGMNQPAAFCSIRWRGGREETQCRRVEEGVQAADMHCMHVCIRRLLNEVTFQQHL